MSVLDTYGCYVVERFVSGGTWVQTRHYSGNGDVLDIWRRSTSPEDDAVESDFFRIVAQEEWTGTLSSRIRALRPKITIMRLCYVLYTAAVCCFCPDLPLTAICVLLPIVLRMSIQSRRLKTTELQLPFLAEDSESEMSGPQIEEFTKLVAYWDSYFRDSE